MTFIIIIIIILLIIIIVINIIINYYFINYYYCYYYCCYYDYFFYYYYYYSFVFIRFKPPKNDRSNAFFKMESRPKSLVRILVPEDKYLSTILDPKRSDSPVSGVSRSMSAVTRSTLSELRYRLFGSKSIKTPDYFRRDGVGKLEGILNIDIENVECCLSCGGDNRLLDRQTVITIFTFSY